MARRRARPSPGRFAATLYHKGRGKTPQLLHLRARTFAPVTPMTATPDSLCDLSDIDDPGAKGFVVEVRGAPRRVFVVRRGAEIFGYINSCPHVGAPLNLEDDKFLDLFKTAILCANHFALFEIGTGYCVRGPCMGKSLESCPVSVQGGKEVAV
jgi:nitrite reductase/ring-hydroxylating ferredoxin subunit